MSSSLNLLERKNIAAGRAAATQSATASGVTPASPHTPRRNPPSTYSSPGSGLRPEEEFVVIELGAREVLVGLAGDTRPKCILGFTREESRRVGDYRRWLPQYAKSPLVPCKALNWGRENELWQFDLKDVDLGLIEDKLERTVRDAFTRCLLQDSKSKRLVLVLPSLVPHPVLASVLTMLFRNFQPPGIVLLPLPTTSILGAGQRSGLVVDIGWHETTVTAVYEFREIKCGRTVRAMRLVTLAMAQLLQQASKGESIDLDHPIADDAMIELDFEFVEEVTTRTAWCRPYSLKQSPSADAQLSELRQLFKAVALEGDADAQNTEQDGTTETSLLKIPRGYGGDETIVIPFATLSSPAESALFGRSPFNRSLDDEEHTIQMLIYEILTSLSPDVRSTCMSRIIFTGAGAKMPGLKARAMNEVSDFKDIRGWNPVWGSAADRQREKLGEIDQNRRRAATHADQDVQKECEPNGDKYEDVPPALAEPAQDTIYEKIRQAAVKDSPDQTSGELRCIESLGAWQGASMAASLKLKGVVEIERESYMQHGLYGAHRDNETYEARSRKSMGGNLARPSVADGSTWTLGLWAT